MPFSNFYRVTGQGWQQLVHAETAQEAIDFLQEDGYNTATVTRIEVKRDGDWRIVWQAKAIKAS